MGFGRSWVRAAVAVISTAACWAVSDSDNSRIVGLANRSGIVHDLVMYGDDVVEALATTHAMEWRYFAKKPRWCAVPLGASGSTVDDLYRRLCSGGETFRLPVRVAVVLIGKADLRGGGDPSRRISVVLRHLEARGATRVVLQALLPDAHMDVRATNERYRRISARLGVTFSTCGGDLDPRSHLYFSGSRLTTLGYVRFLVMCLRDVVEKELRRTPPKAPRAATATRRCAKYG